MADVVTRDRSRRGEGDRLRQEVLEAVNQLLGEWGSGEKLTIRAVAKAVGVAPGSIYLHFTDKADLVWAALTDKYEQLSQDMADAVKQGQDQGPRAALAAQVHAYCRFAVENPGHYRLLYEVRQPAVEGARAGTHPARLVAQRFRDALTACAEGGYALRLPLHQAAHTLWTGLHGLVSIPHSLGISAPAEAISDLADGLVDLVVAPVVSDGPHYPPSTAAEERMIEMVLLRADPF